MTKCQNINCYNGKNCPISQETHDLVKNQKRKAELKRLDDCFRIIRHELELMKKAAHSPPLVKNNLSMLKQIREYMIQNWSYSNRILMIKQGTQDARGKN